jgi:2'-5' RNA ligase
MIKLFVGLALPEGLKARLAPIMTGLPGARWVPPDNLHLTLRFIGEVDEHQAALLDAALSQIRKPPFDLQIAGCGIFAQRRGPEAVWIGVAATPPLTDLQAAIERAAVRAGLAPEERRFRPHITLARLRDTPAPRLQAFVAGHNLFKETVPIGEFALYSSQGGETRHYVIETSYPLESGLGIDT